MPTRTKDPSAAARQSIGQRPPSARGDEPVGLSTRSLENGVTGVLTRKILPTRYTRKEDDTGEYLTCVESPNIIMRIERGMSVTASAARKYPKGTIFLDGVAQGEPFMDSSRKVYNLDHHEGCVRAFTLATCEQALVVILKGLDLRTGEWTVYVNEPDLDAVLALWVLVNHTRITPEDSVVRKRIIPLVRQQGVIDGLGLELKELSGFPRPLAQQCLKTITTLRQEEIRLKNEGQWSSVDLLSYTEFALRSLDELVYLPHEFEGLDEVEELARVQISDDRMAIICRSEDGIYEAEQVLGKLHGDRLGLIVLEKEPGVYTVRQVDPFLPTSLDRVYDRLNLLDAAVTEHSRWGGSGDIGGSPRVAGSALSPQEIAQVCRWVFQPPGLGQRFAAVAGAIGGVIAVLVVATVLAFKGLPGVVPPGMLRWAGADAVALFSCLVAGWSALIIVKNGWRAPVLYGLRRPLGKSWLLMMPVMIGAALLGGAWAPLARGASAAHATRFDAIHMLVPLAGAVAAELLFRGVVFSSLAKVFWIQRPFGRRFSSVPTMLAAGLSAIATVLLFAPPGWSLIKTGTLQSAGVTMGAVMALGLAAGWARERSGSLVAPVALHGAAAVAAWAVVTLLIS